MMRRRLAIAVVLTLAGQLALAGAVSGVGTVTRVSESSDEVQGNGPSGDGAISANGNLVVFASDASSLVANDTNEALDVFVRDRGAGTTARMSQSSAPLSEQGNGDSLDPAISGDGNFVAFASEASNLVPNDTNNSCDNDGDGEADDNCADVFLRARASGTTTRVSISTTGTQGDGASFEPALSNDGRFVAFTSAATNLVSGDTNASLDVFIRDVATSQTSRVSVANDGSQAGDHSFGAHVSADGRFVVFQSAASNLVGGDDNATLDVFVRDRQAGTTRRVSVASDGTGGNDFSVLPSISANGRYVSFASAATNLAGPGGSCDFDDDGVADAPLDVYVHDLQTSITRRVSRSGSGAPAQGCNLESALSADGRFISFSSDAPNLGGGPPAGVAQVLVQDRMSGCTVRTSEVGGTPGNGSSFLPDISGDGRFTSFTSEATNLVPDDTNGAEDVFVNDRGTEAEPVSVQYLPEGATHSGFTTFVLLANPSTTDAAQVSLTFLTRSGPLCPASAQNLTVPPGQRVTVNVNKALEFRGEDVATRVVSAGAQVTAEVSVHRAGSLAAIGMSASAATAPTWIMPEGATHSGFTTFVTLANPSLDATHVDVTYLTKGGGEVAGPQDVLVPGGSRVTINVNRTCECTDDVSTRIEVAADEPEVVAGMSLHKALGNDLGIGGSLGVTAPQAAWVVAEGATHSGFATFVLVANPGEEDATVDVTFLTKSAGPVAPEDLQGLEVPAGGRVTIPVNRYVAADDVSTLVEATAGTVAVESSIQKRDSRGFVIADSVGAGGESVQAVSGTSWLVPEGATHSGFGTFVLIANPDAENDATVNVSFLTRGGGRQQGPLGLRVPAGGRATVPVNRFIAGDDVSTLIEATAAAVVVEMSLDRVAPQGFSKSRSLGVRLP